MKLYLYFTIFLAISQEINAECCLRNGISYPAPRLGDANPVGIAISPDSKYIATSSTGITANYVTLFEVTNYILNNGTNYSLNCTSAIAFSPDGFFVAVGSQNNSSSVTIFKFNNGILSNPMSYLLPNNSSEVNSIAFSKDGNYLATANLASNDVTIFAVKEGILSNGTSYSLPEWASNPCSIAFSPDDTSIAVANLGTQTFGDNGKITMFTMYDGKLNDGIVYSLPKEASQPISVAFSPEGSHLATANFGSNSVTIFDVVNNTLDNANLYDLSSPAPLSVAFSPNGSCLGTANAYANDVITFTFSNGVLKNIHAHFIPANSSYVKAVAYSPNNSYLATANYNSNDVTIFKTGCQ